MKLLYFAWLKTKIGVGEETHHPPPEIDTVGKLLDWLRTRSPKHAEALGDLSVVRVALNMTYVEFDHAVAPGDEVALFPPVTGG